MKNKKKSLIIVSALIVISAVLAIAVLPKLIQSAQNRALEKYFSEDIKNVDNIELVSPSQVVDGKSDTIAGVKESIRLGADSVIVNLCFKKDFTPVICSDYTVADGAQTVEELFKVLCTDLYRNVSIYLNIVQLSDLSKLNSLCTDYNLVDRVFLIGIDKNHYSMISSDDTIIPFFFDYDITSEDIKSAENGEFALPEFLNNYGALGIVIDADDVDKEFVEALNIYSIPFIVKNINSEDDFCKCSLNGAVRLVTNTPERSREIIDLWTASMQERFESSVNKSLEDLSKQSR